MSYGRRTQGLGLALLLAGGLVLPGRSQAPGHVLIAWNDLGMHCANQDFSQLVVLPPYNNVKAQLLRRQPAGPPLLITEGVRLEYSIPGNTTSVTKTNFWDYAQQIFDLPAPLPPNIGLTGNGLSGVLSPFPGYFEVTGVPVTPFQDNDLVNEQPYQLIHVEAFDMQTDDLLAFTDAVIPVSNEIGCVSSGCHSSVQDILDEHPDEAGFNPNDTPILCARCHASPALGTQGIPEAGFLSLRLHEKHHDIQPVNGISTCYKCHPGANAQCLRDVMATNPADPMICQDCHGTMEHVAATIEDGRIPWLDEPSCGSCHGAAFAEEPGTLFRNSRGHGGLYCSACHGSPHAILPSREANDNLQNIRLQGHAGTLSDCRVCHTVRPTSPGPHGISAPPPSEVVLEIHRQAAGQGLRLVWNSLPDALEYRIYRLNEAWGEAGLVQVGATTLTDWQLAEPAAGDVREFYRVTALLP
ncbi:MAG: hypothetical protein WC326_03135 [Candidatus Delongbacteria bacterium]